MPKRQEQQLAKVTTNDFSDFFSLDLNMLAIVSNDGYIVKANNCWEATLGYDLPALQASPVTTLIHKDDLKLTEHMIRMVREHHGMKFKFVVRIKSRINSFHWFENSLLYNNGHYYVSSTDITQFKEHESILSETQAKAKIGAWTLDLATEEISLNQQATRIHGHATRRHMSLAKFLNFYSQSDQQRLRTAIDKTIRQGLSFDQEITLAGDVSRSHWYQISAHPVYLNNQVIALRGTLQDISEKKLISRTSESNRRQFEKLLHNVPGVVLQIKWSRKNPTFSVPFASKRAQHLFGYSQSEMQEMPSPVLSLCHLEDVKGLIEHLHISAADLSEMEWKGRIVTKAEEIRWVHARCLPEALEDGSILWDGIVLDITEAVHREWQLEKAKMESMHAAKMASLGEMAAGIGHEINNPLAIIQGYANRLEKLTNDSAPDQAQVRKCVDKIILTSNRIAKIIKSLRSISYGNDSQRFESCQLNSVIEDVLELSQERFKKHQIDFTIDIPKGLRLQCYPSELAQVVLNLVNNAFDAVQNLEQRWVRITASEKDKEIEIRVSDSGTGVSDELQKRIWEPFFTSKKFGEGTGLGLAIVQKIIQRHKGTIKMNSNSANTCFIIKLPKEAAALEPTG